MVRDGKQQCPFYHRDQKAILISVQPTLGTAITFTIAITGAFAEDADKNLATKQFAKLFKLDEAKAQAILSSGKPRQLVKNVPEAKARQLIERLDAMGLISEAQPPFPPPEPAPLELSLVDEPGALPDQPAPSPAPQIQGNATSSSANAVTTDDEAVDEPDIERAPAMHGFQWLNIGFEMFKAQPIPWIVSLIGFVLITGGIGALPYGEYISILVWPVFFAGMMLGVHQQRETGLMSPFCFLSGFSANPVALMILGIASAVIVAITSALLFVVFGFMGGAGGMFLTLATFIILLPLILTNLFAPTLIAVRGMSVLDAIVWSMKGGLPNVIPVMVHLVVSTLVLMLGAIAFGVGMLVAGPIVICSIYLAYADIFDS